MELVVQNEDVLSDPDDAPVFWLALADTQWNLGRLEDTMTKNEFIEILKANKIDPNMVSFNDDAREGYCVRKNYFGWETLVRERGK